MEENAETLKRWNAESTKEKGKAESGKQKWGVMVS
jgi:hypothetical protein